MRLGDPDRAGRASSCRRSSTRCCSRTPAARPTRPRWPRSTATPTPTVKRDRKVTDHLQARAVAAAPAAQHRAGRLAARQGAPHQGARRARVRGRARADRAALRARRGRGPQRRHGRGDRRGDRARSTSTGTGAAIPPASPATRSRCWAGSSASRRRPRSSGSSAGPAARVRRGPRRGAAPGSTRRWPTRSAPSSATTTSGPRSSSRGWPCGSRPTGWRRVDQARLDRVAEAFADGGGRQVALHGGALRRAWRASPSGLAYLLGLDDRTRRDLYRAGLLHDIGKLGVSNRILDKRGRAGRGRVARGAQASAHVAADPAPGRARCANVARLSGLHHERLDGSGYYLGFDGTQLDLPARVLAVADVAEALSARAPLPRRARPGRGARDHVARGGDHARRARRSRRW